MKSFNCVETIAIVVSKQNSSILYKKEITNKLISYVCILI